MPAQNQYEISPLKLWSPLQRQLAACGQIKGSPQQWIGTIRNLQKKGVSAIEIEWSGVVQMLSELDEIFDELASLALSFGGKPSTEASKQTSSIKLDGLLYFVTTKPACDLVLQRRTSNEYSPQIRYQRLSYPVEFPPTIGPSGRPEVKTLHYQEHTFGLCIWLHVEVDLGLFGHHHSWSVSVPSGRRFLTKHRPNQRFATDIEALSYGRTLIKDLAQRFSQEGFVGSVKGLNRFTRYSLPNGDNYTEWLITAPNLKDKYWGEHFDLPNIVAHVRTTERPFLQGGRLLLMEEIQSDWNQSLREAELKKQLAGNSEDSEEPRPSNPFCHHWVDTALRMMLLLAANQNFAAIAWLPGWMHAERFPWANAAGLTAFYDDLLPMAVSKLGKSWGVGISEVCIKTLSRNFVVRAAKAKNSYLVVERESGKVVEHRFPSIQEADDYRLTLETMTTEQVPALLISEEMRADLITNGLPYLGAVGRRVI